VKSPQSRESSGRVFLVGAGPGDPGLLTLRGVQCLAEADLIICDRLVNTALLAHASPSAEVIALGHHAMRRDVSQQQINRMLIDAARQGRTVVRLKGGDPDVFGRSSQETDVLIEAGIAIETVPGVTAMSAAAAYAGIPITHADTSSAVALVTGKERPSKGSPPLDYGKLADFPGTLVFYMGVTSAERWSKALLDGGRPADDPVAIVRRCTWADQQTVRCTLGTVAAEIQRRGLRPPAVIVVGDVVRRMPEATWFTSRPLFGHRVMVTRPRGQGETLGQRLAELGAEVVLQPAIEIADPPDWTPVDAAIGRLSKYDWLVFSSANGVDYFLRRLLANGKDLRDLAGRRLAAIGPGTGDALNAFSLRPDLVPEAYRAEALADALIERDASAAFLLIRASRGREVLAERLRGSGGTVDQVVAYTSADVQEPVPHVAQAVEERTIDWVTVTSSAIARSLVRLFGKRLNDLKLASISPVTSATLRELGHEPSVEAAEYTTEAVVRAIVDSQRGNASA
jgi:uroporphyrinogen III methyltransferase/synthase